jgi:hypothetical protein
MHMFYDRSQVSDTMCLNVTTDRADWGLEVNTHDSLVEPVVRESARSGSYGIVAPTPVTHGLAAGHWLLNSPSA